MKPRWFALFFAAVALVLLVPFSVQTPFEALRPSDIACATVHLTPPDESLPIADTESLSTLLRALTLSRLPTAPEDEAGQSVLFVLRMTDGSSRQVRVRSSAVELDGTPYRASAEACAALSQYANRLRTHAH